MKKGTGKYTPALILYLLMAGTAIHAETQTETSAMPHGTEEGTELCGQSIPATTPGVAENAAAYTLNRYTQPGPSLSPQFYGENMISVEPEYQHHTIYANLNYGRIISTVYMVEGASGNPKNGFSWQLGYEWTAKAGIGAGLMYNGFKSSFYMYDIKCNVNLTYIAPQIVYKKYYDTWAFEAKAGVGYFSYKESATSVSGSMSGLGYNLHLGIEYLVAEHVGIGASIGYIEGSLPEQREATEHNKRTGMSTLNIGAGVRFHF